MAECANCGRESADGFAFCPHCGAALAKAPATQEQRKVVTVLFCDVVGSTALGESTDPEALRALLARYFDRMKAAVERHGGTVEKFIGDAVMAVFGVPVVHEDDALRAVRAAIEMRAAFVEVGIEGRIGIATGEVVTGTEERLATGDAVNVAARLEQAAEPGQILLAQETFGLVREFVEADAVEPLRLKGKSEPVPSFRLVSVAAERPRRHEAPMVGREREQRLLAEAWGGVRSERSCHLFTVLGPAGVGKSRLVAEFLARLDGATIAHGRCLPYGDGITYWPVVEVVKQLPQVELDARASAAIGDLLGEERGAISSEEIAWGFRKLLETVAAEGPLVCVLDDLQWGEETFLDLVEHVADLSRDAPILLLCTARPDLLDRRPAWGGGKVNATTVLLEPLRPEDADRLIDSLGALPAGLRDRIREAAEGNPLFVEEMVAMVRESPGRDVVVPPTIQALLSARIDQLDPVERAVLQRGSVEGRVFHRGSVQALTPEDGGVGSSLTALVRKELVRPDRGQFPDDEAYRFRHLLIRDAAYDALPKAARADLHERFGRWLEAHGEHLVELDEIVGYHLEQAYHYRSSLGGTPDGLPELGAEAADRLAAAAHRALSRSDVPAAVHLLERAADLRAEDDPKRLAYLPALGRALVELGQWGRAEELLARAVEESESQGLDVVAAEAAVELAYVRLHVHPETTHADVQQVIDGAIRVFEEAQHETGLASALYLSGSILFWAGRCTESRELLERAVLLARSTGNRSQEGEFNRFLALVLTEGPTPASEVSARIDRLGLEAGEMSSVAVTAQRSRGEVVAMQGDFERAREHVRAAKSLAEELGLETHLNAAIPRVFAEVEFHAGDPVRAEPELRSSCEWLERADDWGHLSSMVPYLVDVLLVQGRLDEADSMLDKVADRLVQEDMDAQVGVRRVRAKVLARRGQFEEAEDLAREAVELAAETEFLNLHAKALCDLGEVLRLAGQPERAEEALEQALGLYERKENLAMAKQVRARLAELAVTPG